MDATRINSKRGFSATRRSEMICRPAKSFLLCFIEVTGWHFSPIAEHYSTMGDLPLTPKLAGVPTHILFLCIGPPGKSNPEFISHHKWRDRLPELIESLIDCIADALKCQNGLPFSAKVRRSARDHDDRSTERAAESLDMCQSDERSICGDPVQDQELREIVSVGLFECFFHHCPFVACTNGFRGTMEYRKESVAVTFRTFASQVPKAPHIGQSTYVNKTSRDI
jgi:hypothetical protein